MRLAAAAARPDPVTRLGDQVEARAEQDACDPDDQHARGKGAQAGEIDQAGGECGESWVVRGRRQERVVREEMMCAENVLGVSQVDVLVAEGEGVGRGKYLHEVQRDAENDDERQPLLSIDIWRQSAERDWSEDEEEAEPIQHGRRAVASRVDWLHRPVRERRGRPCCTARSTPPTKGQSERGCVIPAVSRMALGPAENAAAPSTGLGGALASRGALWSAQRFRREELRARIAGGRDARIGERTTTVREPSSVGGDGAADEPGAGTVSGDGGLGSVNPWEAAPRRSTGWLASAVPSSPATPEPL